MLQTSELRLVQFPRISDTRGSLMPIEWPLLPFTPKRIFYIWDVTDGTERGDHAHYKTQQFIMALSGCLQIYYFDGMADGHIVLDSPCLGLYVPPGYWIRTEFQNSALMLVLADLAYDAADYITDLKVFKEWRNNGEA